MLFILFRYLHVSWLTTYFKRVIRGHIRIAIHIRRLILTDSLILVTVEYLLSVHAERFQFVDQFHFIGIGLNSFSGRLHQLISLRQLV
jgi:hypothetical protein